MALHWSLSHAAARSPWLSHLLEGRSIPLGGGGQLEERALARHAVSEADIHEALRSAGLEDTAKAQRMVLEPSGKISVPKNG